jgi:hypothetical protein
MQLSQQSAGRIADSHSLVLEADENHGFTVHQVTVSGSATGAAAVRPACPVRIAGVEQIRLMLIDIIGDGFASPRLGRRSRTCIIY